MDQELQQHITQRGDTLARIRRILVEKLGVRRELDEIDPDTPLFGSGLGLDSVDAVELLMCLEMEFSLHLSGDAADRAAMRTVNTLVDLVMDSKETHEHGK